MHPRTDTFVALAIAGVIVTSVGRKSEGGTTTRLAPSILFGLLAALGFGCFFSAMDMASEGDIPWALLLARLTAVTIYATVAVVTRHRPTVRGTDLPVVACIGVLIVAADSMYAVASTLGLVGIVAVLSSLHPIVTIALARIYLKERLARLQQLGIAAAIGGVLAIAAT